MAYGFDGIECYHPSQSDADIRFCVDLCRARGLIITAGSDAHGAFSAAQMGELRTTIGDLTMGGLVFEQPDACPRTAPNKKSPAYHSVTRGHVTGFIR